MPNPNVPKTRIFKFRFIFISCLMFFYHAAFSQATAEQNIRQLYHTLDTKPNAKPTPMATRLNHISQAFLDKPYANNALGEGPTGKYDQGELYRTDAFDCETYVDTVIAIALAPDFTRFEQCINYIRYHQGKVLFTHRNHFASLDWNQNNQSAGILKDITTTLKNQKGEPAALMAKTFINKPQWYKNLTQARIRLPHASDQEQQKQLKALQRESKHLKAQYVTTPYIPLTALFDEEGTPNQMLFDQIPNASILEIIRPNWDLTSAIGTHLNISHLGFVFRKPNGKLRFRHASSLKQRVSDMDLIQYLREARTSPSIRGINIQIIIPETPDLKNCA